jgi:hypothetical protein
MPVPTGRVGLCREAAIQNSPGFLTLGQVSVKGALKVATDVGAVLE